MILRRYTPEQNAAILFALGRTALSVYRAATQSLSIDESAVFLNFLRGPWAKLYQHYDVSNHLLYSILAKVSIHWFGVSEFSLRLPSVLAGLFLMLGVYRILEQAVESRAVRWAALIVVGLNPLLLDLTIAARGYGLGLALLIWAMVFAMRGRELSAGVLAGLSVCSVLVMSIPAAALAVSIFFLADGEFSKRWRSALDVAIPAMAVAFLIAYPAVRDTRTDQFYFGERTFGGSVMNLILTSIRASVTRSGLFGTSRAARVIEYGFLPAILAFIVTAAAWTYFRKPDSRITLVPAAAFAVSLMALGAVHQVLGFNYPEDRVGIYLFVLLALSWAVAAAQLPLKPGLAAHGVLAGALALQFTTQIELRYFSVWDFDLPAKQIARILKSETDGRDPESISLSASWFQTPSLEFYRYHYGIGALEPIERRDPTVLTGFDYYVLNTREDDSVKGRDLSRLIPIYRDPVSGVVLAKDPDSH